MAFGIEQLAAATATGLAQIANAILRVRDTFEKFVPPPPPRHFKAILKGEMKMATVDAIGYDLVADAPGASDVVKRRLTITADAGTHFQFAGNDVAAGPDPAVYELDGQPTALGEFKLEESKSATLALADVDNARNVSDSSSFSLTATDTTPPPAPGAFGATNVRDATIDI